jgi:hypothetical protein
MKRDCIEYSIELVDTSIFSAAWPRLKLEGERPLRSWGGAFADVVPRDVD